MKEESKQLIDKLEKSKHNIVSAAELEPLSSKLLSISLEEDDPYGAAVAYYFLALAYYQKGNTGQCLSHAVMCNELSTCNQFACYYISSCNLIGIIYVAMSEQFLALDYYLKGYYAAKDSNNYDFGSRILNNIGDMFHNLGVFEEAILYFKKAKLSREQSGLDKDDTYAIIVMNIVECELMLGREEEAKEAILQISGWLNKENSEVLNGIMASNQILYVAGEGNYELAAQLARQLLDKALGYYEYSHTFHTLLRIRTVIYKLRDKALGERYIHALKAILDKMDSIHFRLLYLETAIEYYSAMEEEERWRDAIIEYYHINKQNNQIRKNSHYSSLMAKVQLEEILQEQAKIIRQNKELELLSEIDELTQIFNRRAAEKYIMEKLAAGSLNSTCALIIIDLDFFKDINDSFGHMAGDTALAHVAALLKQNFRENAIVGRLGGDEFIIFLYTVHWEANAAKEIICQRLHSLLGQIRKIRVPAIPRPMSASVGIALIQNRSSFHELYRRSDLALYEAKRRGRGCFVFFDDIKSIPD